MVQSIRDVSVAPTYTPITSDQLQPTQLATAYAAEWKGSRPISVDLQRGMMVYIFIIAGRPDQVAKDQTLGGMREGMPHPWETDTYISRVTFEHHIHGPDPSTGYNTPGTARDAQAYTKMTVTYRQMPWPGQWEEDWSVALISRLEWWDHTETPKSIKGTREGVSILHPVPVYKRHFPKVELGPVEWDSILGEIGATNGRPWMHRPISFWQFTGKRARLLYGNPRKRSAWELTLIFRGDPVRHHEWWLPVLDATQKPMQNPPAMGAEDLRTYWINSGAIYRRRLYRISERNWDRLIPRRRTPEGPTQES